MNSEIASARVILLAGEEFQRSLRLAEVLEEAVDPATRDFNLDVIRPDDFDTGRLAEIVMTFPMMAARRVVVLRDFDSLHPEHRKKAAAVLVDTPETTLVVVEGEKAALAPKPKTGLVSESFRPVYENKLPAWVAGRFRARGRKADDRAIALLINNVGTELRELDSEIEKIVIIAGDRTAVTGDDAGRVVGAFRRDTVYGLNNAVGLGDFAEAARILDNLMETEKDRETFYLASLSSHILKIAEYNRQIAGGVPREEAMKTVTTSPFLWRLNRMDEQVRRFGPRMVRRSLSALGRTESLLKKSAMDRRLLLELMLPFVVPQRRV